VIVLKRDRRSKARIIQNDVRELQPLIDAGYPLIDIWEGYRRNRRIAISYRHFIRTLGRLRKKTPGEESRSAADPVSTPESSTTWKN
jgi:hypothetical protein